MTPERLPSDASSSHSRGMTIISSEFYIRAFMKCGRVRRERRCASARAVSVTHRPTCFETFPFPEATEQHKTDISTAAKELNELRETWLNPPEWITRRVLEFPGSIDGPWSRFVVDADARGIGTVRYPRIEARDDDCAKKLAKRTLTNLYNERPAWLGQRSRQTRCCRCRGLRLRCRPNG